MLAQQNMTEEMLYKGASFFPAKQKKLKLFAQSSFFCNFVSNKRKSNKKT